MLEALESGRAYSSLSLSSGGGTEDGEEIDPLESLGDIEHQYEVSEDRAVLAAAWELASRLRDANVLWSGRTDGPHTDVLPHDHTALSGGARVMGYPAGSGATLSDVLVDLDARHPGLRDRIVDEKGLRRFVNVYVNDEDVRFMGGLETALKDGDTVTVLPAVAGG